MKLDLNFSSACTCSNLRILMSIFATCRDRVCAAAFRFPAIIIRRKPKLLENQGHRSVHPWRLCRRPPQQLEQAPLFAAAILSAVSLARRVAITRVSGTKYDKGRALVRAWQRSSRTNLKTARRRLYLKVTSNNRLVLVP